MQFSAENSDSANNFNLFASTFLKPSLINEILDKPGSNVEELLNQEDFLDELRRGNFRLIDYFANANHIKQLIDYIIQTPPDLKDEKRAYQYPLLANEIFEANVDLIMNCFFLSNNRQEPNPNLNHNHSHEVTLRDDVNNNETALHIKAEESLQNNQDRKNDCNENKMNTNSKKGDLLSYLFGFLDTREELNPVLSGYFCKVLQKLINRGQKAMIEFVYKNSKFLFGMVEHIDQHSIAEILPLFICYESYVFDDNTSEYLQIKLEVIDKIFSTLNDETKPEKIAHIPDVLDEIMHKYETMADGKEIMGKILCHEIFDKVFNIFKNKLSNSAAIHTGNVILLLLGHFTAKISQYSAGGAYAQYFQMELEEDPIIKTINRHLETLKQFLLIENLISISTTFGQNSQTLGIGRLKVVTIIERIMRIGSKRIYSQINALGIVQIITDMFARFVWNNMLHTLYEKLVYTILDKRDPLLLEALFEKAAFIEYMIKEIKNEEFELPKSRRKIRKGNMGFIIRIANELNRLGSFDKTLEDQLKKNPDWENIVIPSLKARNELNEKEMGGCHPRNMNFGLLDNLMGYIQFDPNTAGGFGNNGLSSNILQSNQRPFVSYPLDYNDQTNDQTVPQEQKIMDNQGLEVPNSSDLGLYLPCDQPEISKVKIEQLNCAQTTEENQPENKQITPTACPPFNAFSNDKDIPKSEKSSKEMVLNLEDLSQKEHKLKSFESKISSLFQDVYQNSITTSVSVEITQEAKNKEQTDLSKRVSEQLRSSNDILSRLKMELSLSPTRETKDQEIEEKSSSSSISNVSEPLNPSPVSSSSEGKLFRSSMIETKSGKKVKLKVKKTEKLDGSKILDMINKFKGPSSTSSLEFSYTDNSQSESGIILNDGSHTAQEVLPKIPPMQTNPLSQKAEKGS